MGTTEMNGVRRVRVDEIKAEMVARHCYNGRGMITWTMERHSVSHATGSRDVQLARQELLATLPPLDEMNVAHLLVLDGIVNDHTAKRSDRIRAATEFGRRTGIHVKRVVIEGSDETQRRLQEAQAKLMEDPRVRDLMLELDEDTAPDTGKTSKTGGPEIPESTTHPSAAEDGDGTVVHAWASGPDRGDGSPAREEHVLLEAPPKLAPQVLP